VFPEAYSGSASSISWSPSLSDLVSAVGGVGRLPAEPVLDRPHVGFGGRERDLGSRAERLVECQQAFAALATELEADELERRIDARVLDVVPQVTRSPEPAHSSTEPAKTTTRR
jgi:hypothetical protein